MYNNETLRQGRFRPKFPDKYKGDPRKIVYRSGWELKVMHWLDRHPSVIQWASEELSIPYKSPVDGLVHRYFPDFWVRFKSKAGGEKTVLLEVKPKKYTEAPKPKKKPSQRHLQEMATWYVNMAKWHAANEYAKRHDLEFRLVTENELGIDK